MAVELRCPNCRAKLRLPEEPDPDSEIECPKCEHVFPCEANVVRTGSKADGDRPAQKQQKDDRPAGETAKRGDPKEKSGKQAAGRAEKPFKRKKRKAKKRKTKPVVLVSIIVGAVMIVSLVAGVLVWYLTKAPAGQELMSYLPDDCDEVVGLNVGAIQKYPDFYKSCEPLINPTGFKRAADVLSKALGRETKDTLEYVIQGAGTQGGKADGTPVQATVLRTKAEFDPGLLSKIPEAKEYAAAGVKYYTIQDIPELGYPGLRVFAPTNRVVVFCRGDMPEATFKSMLGANKDNPDKTVYARSRSLGKQVSRGTAWKFALYGRSIARPAKPPTGGEGVGGQSNEQDLLKVEIADILSNADGYGVRASVGASSVSGEFVLLYKDSDMAANTLKKWKEKDWIKDDEKSPPRWWNALANMSGGGRTSPAELKDGLSFSSSGDTLTARSKMAVKSVQGGITTIVTALR